MSIKSNRIIEALPSYVDIIGLFVLSVFILTFRLQGVALGGDEAIYSQVARESLNNLTVLDFTWRNEPWFEKPPLVIWYTMAAFQIFGTTESAARIFPVFFGITTLILIYYIARSLFKNRLAAALSFFILLSSSNFIWFARKNVMDLPITFFIALSLFSFWKISEDKDENKKRWLLVAGSASGLAILTKGLVGFFPIIIWVIYSLLHNDWRGLCSKRFLIPILIALIVILPWHIVMSFRHGTDFWNSYFNYHVLHRFSHNLNLSTGGNDSLFYFREFTKRISVLNSIFVITIIFYAESVVRAKDKRLSFLVIWIAVFLLIFSLSKTRLLHYMLPVIVPFSCLIGKFIADLYRKRSALGYTKANGTELEYNEDSKF